MKAVGMNYPAVPKAFGTRYLIVSPPLRGGDEGEGEK